MAEKIRILVVEDDGDISNMLRDLLIHSGYEVETAFSGTEALRCLHEAPYQLMLLDLMLPGLSGQQVLEQVRRQSAIPVIGLSAKDDAESKIALLRAGADDYLTKPFHTGELLARVESVLRRQAPQAMPDPVLTFKDLTLDPDSFQVSVGGRPVSLTRREYKILELLMSNPGKVFTKNNIFESVWEECFLGEDNAVNVHISNIRQKLAKENPDENYIQTVWGIGFKMCTA